jgi:protein gp37
MATKTKIEWTEMSWNPVTGCTKVSPGCFNCYAEKMALRLKAMGQKRYRNGFSVTLQPDLLDQPDKWITARTIFVNSMSDLFHEKIPLDYIKKVFATIQRNPHHTFQVLTKRSERLAKCARELTWPHNLWIGVSVENFEVLHRISHLKSVKAAVRFVSCEPLLGPIKNIPLKGIHWVIVGGESGPKSRPMKEAWVESIKRQCKEYGTAFFFKQWGGTQKKRNGRLLKGRIYNEMPATASQQIQLLFQGSV